MDSPATGPQDKPHPPGLRDRAAIWQRVNSASLAERPSPTPEGLPWPLQPCTSLASWASDAPRQPQNRDRIQDQARGGPCEGQDMGTPVAAPVLRVKERQPVAEANGDEVVCQRQPKEGESVHRGQLKDGEGEGEEQLAALERKIEMAALWALEQKMSIIDAQRRWSAAHCARFLRGLNRDHCHRGTPSQRRDVLGTPTVQPERGPQAQHQPWEQSPSASPGQERRRRAKGDRVPRRTLSGGVPRSRYCNDSPGLLERAPRGCRSNVGGSRMRGPSSAGDLPLSVHL